MDKKTLIEKIRSGEISKETFNKENLIKWVSGLPGSTGNLKPSYSKKGDVYMHPIFQHPYVLLKKMDEDWLCTLLTTDVDCEEILEPCDSRFFGTSHFTKVLFTIKEPSGGFCNPYENKKQLKSVLKKLREIVK